MYDINGQFKVCTCSEKVDKKKPRWVLKIIHFDYF